MTTELTSGRVVSINVSRGGVPKLSVPSAQVTHAGVEGDAQNDTQHHGGPERAVCIFSMELIDKLQAEGHPILPGSTGENLTIEGLDWQAITPGVVLRFENGPVLEVASYCQPCKTIRGSFLDESFARLLQQKYPGESRLYCRVLEDGVVSKGQTVLASHAKETS